MRLTTKRMGKRVLAVLTSLFLGISSAALGTSAASYTVMDLSSTLVMDVDPDRSEILGKTATIWGHENFIEYKNGTELVNQLVRFKLKVNSLSDGWISFNFGVNDTRSMIYAVEEGYGFLVFSDHIAVCKQELGGTFHDAITRAEVSLNDGQEHEIVVGIYDTVQGKPENGVTVFMQVDGQTVIDYNDTDKPVTRRSIFSAHLYQDSTSASLSVITDRPEDYAGQVDRPLSAQPDKALQEPEVWSTNKYVGSLAPEQGSYGAVHFEDGAVRLEGEVAATYKNQLDTAVYGFQVSVKDAEGAEPGKTLILLNKHERDVLYGDYAYGLSITSDGRIGLFQHQQGTNRLFPCHATGLDFTKPQTIRVEIVKTGALSAEIYVYVNEEKPYKYVNTRHLSMYGGESFLGVVNQGDGHETVLSQIVIGGEETPYSAEEAEVKPIYFADFFTDAETGENSLHWSYRDDSPSFYQVLIEDKHGNRIAAVAYPENSYVFEEPIAVDTVVLTAVDMDGTRSPSVTVDLTEKRSQYYADTVERIQVQADEDGAYFKLKESGERIFLNGGNYVGLRFGDHSTFEGPEALIPGYYDPYKAETLFKTLKKTGYNAVRVFVIQGGRNDKNLGLGGHYDTTVGIYKPYMENFVDFLTRAHRYGIYVMPCFGENEMVDNQWFEYTAGGATQYSVLFSQKGIDAKAQYIQWFMEYIKEVNPELLKTMFAISAQNEFIFTTDVAPFNMQSGTYTYLDGSTYDMANDDDRQALARRALQYYYAAIKESMKSVDPEVLLTEGTYTPHITGKDADDWYGMRVPEGANTCFPMSIPDYLEDTALDFLDVHLYRSQFDGDGGADVVFENSMRSMKFYDEATQELLKERPVMIGEYGAMKMGAEVEYEKGLEYVQEIQELILENGLCGSLVWTLDSFAQPELWHLMENNGQDFGALIPKP